MSREYKFSIVMAIYNTEMYVADAIESVINQTIGFENNVQLILVNDGSKDSSEEICKRYRDRYPSNIVYIKKENRGVSSARNRGLKEVRGKYVNFLDSDDKLAKDALQEVWRFFEKRHKEIDFVSLPIHFFEASMGEHQLNFKFDESKIIDIYEEPKKVQLHVASSFFKSDIAKKHSFDNKLAYAEDMKYVTEVLLDKCKYGVLSTSKYLYRKRYGESSAMQTTLKKKTWYLDTLKYGFHEILKTAKKKFKEIPKYVQNVSMYDLQYRLKLRDFGILDEDESETYLNTVKDMLRLIDNDVIFNQDHYGLEYKILALSLKYDKKISEIADELDYSREIIKFRGTPTGNQASFKLNLRVFEIKDKKLHIEGLLKDFRPKDKLNFYLSTREKDFPIPLKRFENEDVIALEREILPAYRFNINLPLQSDEKINAHVGIDNEAIPVRIRFHRGLESRYITKEGYIIRHKNDELYVYKQKFFQQLYLELKYWIKLLKDRKIKVLGIRCLYWIFKLFKRREIWLFMDRKNKAGDNAQALFEYAVKQKDNKRKIFSIQKGSEDYEKMKKIGEVIPWRSPQFLLYFLITDIFISSHADEFIINPFGKYQKYYSDLYDYKYVFLQHGVTHNDLSGWLNKLAKNIKIFVTSAKPEYKSIISNNYLYTKDEVKLTGMPRYDKLENNPKKRILIMPTWRQYLKQKKKEKDSKKSNNYFLNSEYFQFYNELINDKRLLEKVDELGYEIKFCLHPSAIENARYFEDNDWVNISTEICNYSKEFSEGSLLVTDYSSVAFDFAYLRKPIIYSQFDPGELFEKHIYKRGYFDYKDNGFGPVCGDLDSTVNNIISILEGGCKLEEKYIKRINDFFRYKDRNNSERVYKYIDELN